MDLQSDNFIGSITDKLKELAHRLRTQEEPSDQEDLILQLRFWFSTKYGIPMYSPVLENYSLKDMLLEHYLHTWEPPAPPDTNELIQENQSKLADDIAAAFSEEENAFMDDVFNFSEES
jgi:hypothetical protein